MTQLDVASPEAVSAVETALKWLNMKVNQIKPFVASTTKSVVKEADGSVRILIILVTEAFAGKEFEFELVLNPTIDNPTALVSHKQLSP